jgi:hypothetical protein
MVSAIKQEKKSIQIGKRRNKTVYFKMMFINRLYKKNLELANELSKVERHKIEIKINCTFI